MFARSFCSFPSFLSPTKCLSSLLAVSPSENRFFSEQPATLDFRKAVGEDGERVARIGAIKARKKTPRWYQMVDVVPVNGKYEVVLDGRRVQTPEDNRLRVTSPHLAHGIAFEWMRQPQKIRPSTMPLMRHACTAIDRLPKTRDTVIQVILEHLHTDTATCRARKNTHPELHTLQKKTHDPLIRWFCEHFRVHLNTEETLECEQPSDTITVLQWYLHNLDDWTLAGLDVLVQCARSTVIAMAIFNGRLSIEEGLKASRVEERSQQDEWGFVEGAHDVSHTDLSLRMLGAGLYLQTLKM